MISPEMVKAGRDLAGWSQTELAVEAGLSLPTIQRMEHPDFGPGRSSHANVQKLTDAFARKGVSFATKDGRMCVCLDPKGVE